MYQILMHDDTYQQTAVYLNALKQGNATAGGRLQQADFSTLSITAFIALLLNSKQPQIFAETAVYGDGRDWNLTELGLLGDISIGMAVMVYDNGRHFHPAIHPQPFKGTLVYVPGALLRNGQGLPPADWDEVTRDGVLDTAGYYALYARRLLPVFAYINAQAQAVGRMAFVTIPGLGCGQFAGKFHGRLGAELERVLVRFLLANNGRFPHIKAVYYDPYQECANVRTEVGHISFLVRPLTQGNDDKPQLCPPAQYEDRAGEFANCDLFSLVAWDHVSWPGNDFYIGSRATDDGVKAAATDTMRVMTGVAGRYNRLTYQYEAGKTAVWNDIVQENAVKIVVHDNLSIYR
jgi:hypothetical protein